MKQVVDVGFVADISTADIAQLGIGKGIEFPEGLAFSPLALLYDLLHAALFHLRSI